MEDNRQRTTAKRRGRTNLSLPRTDDALLEKHMRHLGEVTKVSLVTLIVELIADGYYDDKIEKRKIEEKYVAFFKGREKEAKAKAKALGYTSLTDAVHDAIRYEEKWNYRRSDSFYNGLKPYREEE